MIHGFYQGPWKALSVQRHFRMWSVGAGCLPGYKEVGYRLPRPGHYAEDCVRCASEDHQSGHTSCTLAAEVKTMWVPILERKCFVKAAWVQAEFLAGIVLAKWHFDRLAATQKQYKERRK